MASSSSTSARCLSASVFLGEGYRKVWAKLRHRGIRTSRGRVLRLMREHELRAPTRSGAPRGPRSHEGTIIPPAPNMRWDGSDRSNATASDRPLSGAVTMTLRPNSWLHDRVHYPQTRVQKTLDRYTIVLSNRQNGPIGAAPI